MARMTTPTALITGATSGVGLHIARQFAELGWTVLVGARDAARGAEAAAQFAGRPLLLDVTDPETIATAAAAVPQLDVLINNAGVSLDTGASVSETGVESSAARTRPTCSARSRSRMLFCPRFAALPLPASSMSPA